MLTAILCAYGLTALGEPKRGCEALLQRGVFYASIRKTQTQNASVVMPEAGLLLPVHDCVSVGAGVASVEYPTEYLSGRWQFSFRLLLEKPIEEKGAYFVGLQHMSNGGRSKPNYGEDYLLLGYGVNF